jgi:serine/threonine protein kinase
MQILCLQMSVESVIASAPHEAQDFLHKCMNANPRERASIEQLLRHPFLNQAHQGPGALRMPSMKSTPALNIMPKHRCVAR